MTVTLELRPEIEAKVKERAQTSGVALEQYLERIIEDYVQPPWNTPRLSADEMRAALDKLAEMGRGLPHLPDSALTRESIYGDHD